MEVLIVLLLIIFNGIFAMAEIAIVSARKSKLAQQAQDGNKPAQAALELAKSPNRFLSTIQIGITFISILAGAFGGERIAKDLSVSIASIPFLAPFSDGVALFLVVVAITYLSLIIGELVPKRLALTNPVLVAKIVAGPLSTVSKIAGPLVNFVTFSTDFVLKALKVGPSSESMVSEEEVRLLIREGARLGVFNLAEKEIVERTFRLSDKKVNTIMTSRKEITWLDISEEEKSIRKKIVNHPHTHFPVSDGNLNKIVGVVRTEDILKTLLAEDKISLRKIIRKPLFIPETIEAIKVLEMFKTSGVHMALVVDEYGGIMGILSLTDVLEEIVGDIPEDTPGDNGILRREDGSFLIDGLTTIDEFKDHFGIHKLPDEKAGDFQTVGGFVTDKLDRIPAPGDKFDWDEYTFEVVDMDQNRVDKVLVTQL